MTQNNSSLILKKKPQLKDYQQYIKDMVKQRGFDKETLPEMFMLFLEECGELAKAAKKLQKKIKVDKSTEQLDFSQEAADVFIYFLQICNYFELDLEKAFRDKEEINKTRSWS